MGIYKSHLTLLLLSVLICTMEVVMLYVSQIGTLRTMHINMYQAFRTEAGTSLVL